jgi:putative ABC transport system permease protein
MREVILQSVENLRVHKLRSVLTMFGVAWGMVSVVILTATGEGFRRGNDKSLREMGQNVAILRSGRTSMQAGGERAGRRIALTADDARALVRESPLIDVVSPELSRTAPAKSAYNSASSLIAGIEPPYQAIRTIQLEYGRPFTWRDEEQHARVAIVGFTVADQLFGKRQILGEQLVLNGLPYTVVGKVRKKEQDVNYDGPDNNKIFVPFATMSRDMPRPDVEPGVVTDIVVAPKPSVVDDLPRVLNERTGRIDDIDWPLERSVRSVLARRHQFDANDKEALDVWDTSLQTLMFGRMIDRMRTFFATVGLVTLALGAVGVMNIMLVAITERTREVGIRKAVGATTGSIWRQFFIEGFFLTFFSGAGGLAIALAVCAGVNRLPLPARFDGLIVSWRFGGLSLVMLTAIGAMAATYPAARASRLPPVESLRVEM